MRNEIEKPRMSSRERQYAVALAIVAAAVALSLAYEFDGRRGPIDAQSTLTATDIVATNSLQLNTATGSSLGFFDSSKKLVSYTGSACGGGSAVSSIGSDGKVSCIATGTSGAVTSTATTNFIPQMSSSTSIANWGGSGCSSGSALVALTGSGVPTCAQVMSGTGTTNDLVIRNGAAGATSDYAGSACAGGSAVNAISATGALTCISASGGGMSIGGAVTSGTAGSILYVDTGPVLAQDNANFFWDKTNHRLGIGDTGPGYALTVKASSTIPIMSLRNTNASGYTAFSTFDSGGTERGGLGFGNPSSAAQLAGKNYLYTANGNDWEIADATATRFLFDMTNFRMGIGVTPSFGIDLKASINASAIERIENASTSGYSALLFANSSGTEEGDVGYANASAGLSHLAGKNYIYSAGPDWVIATSSAVKFYFDMANDRLGIGKTPANTLSLSASASGAGIMDVTNTSSTGFSDILFYNSGGTTLVGAVGYANSGETAVSSAAGYNILYSEQNTDWALVNGGANQAEHIFGQTDGSVYDQLRNGSSAAASAANTGRIRYNTTGQLFQASANAGSYFNLLVSNYIFGTGTPTASAGTLGTGSDDFSGSLTSVGATTTTLTYAVAATNRSRCTATFNGHAVAPEIIEITNSASAPIFNCFNSTTGIAANCDDFTYICAKQ